MAATTIAIDAETRRKANLRVLQRIDHNIVDLAITATHVVLYEYNANSGWEKMNVEGTLFVTKRSDVPRFKLIVLNRSSAENIEVPITASFQMQVKDPYLIFRESAKSNDFRGFWFHDGDERDRIASHLEQVVKSLIQLDEIEKKSGNPSLITPKSSHNTKVEQAEAMRRDAGAALLSALNLGATKLDSNENTAVSQSTPDTALLKPPLATTPPRLVAASTAEVATSARPGMTPISSSMHSMVHGDSTQMTIPPSSSSSSSASSSHLVLDRKNLQLTLLSLLHDERFLDLIHAQYLKVVHRRHATIREGEEPDGNSNSKK